MQLFTVVFASLIVGMLAYLLSYLRFRRKIAVQTQQMIALIKSEDLDGLQVGNIYNQADEEFSDLERAALSLRKKYLRLRRQSQEERRGYETVFSGLKEGIVTVDQNLRIISFNDSFMNFFQWAPLKEQSGYFLQDVIRDPGIIATFKKTFQSQQINKNEADLYQLFVTPLPSRNENESWCLGVFYDLSEIRKTEKIRIDFVANASHEMRTPLTVIKGYSELLRQRLVDKNLAAENELLQPIMQSAEQMSLLMDELLNLSKLEQGAVLAKSVLQTEAITADVLEEIGPILKLSHKKIDVHTQAREVHANVESVRQILRNLLVNAVKYSGESEAIQISWLSQPGSVQLRVKDFGPGIPKAQQDRIFERFYRVDKGRAREQGGYGLGLALVKHHVLNHGGSIRLVSEENAGSEFICEFPNE
jgi:two-component system phosphate regulon sensor histidine kinase PhoR